MMSKIDRYEVLSDGLYEEFESGDWCKYEDVKAIIEKLETRVDTLEMAIMRREECVLNGRLPH